MGHGAPDWSNVRKGQVIYRLDDMAELAARLGSIDTFDRRGDVLFMDDFQHGVSKWANDSAGSAGTVELTTTAPLFGTVAALLRSSPTSSYYTNIARADPYPALSKFGIEAGIHCEANEDYIRVGLLLFTGTNRYRYYLELDPVDGVVRYLNSAGGWTDIQSIPAVSTYGPIYHRLKLVADLDAKEYVRGFYDAKAFTLPGIAGHLAAASDEEHLFYIVSFAAPSAAEKLIRVGYVIVTQNEP